MENVGSRNVGKRGTTMAISCAAAISLGLGAMYFAGRDVKSKEGQASVHAPSGMGKDGTDKAMSSTDVAAVASGVPSPFSKKDRVPGGTTVTDSGRS